MDYTIKQFDVHSELISTFSSMTKEVYANDSFYIPSQFTGNLDGQFFLVMQNERPIARAVTMINDDIRFNDLKTGLVGYYEAFNEMQAVELVFEEIEKYLKSQDCQYVIGPVNGSTWKKYRVTVPDSNEPFFLDNYNKPWYGDQFESNGFEIIARYYSSRQIPVKSNRIEKFQKHFSDKGIQIRPIQNFQDDLGQIYELSRISFSSNYLYTPIDENEFMEMYYPIERYIDPNYVLLAEDNTGKVVGFVFAVPNVLSKEVKSLVIKTLAVLPEASSRGLGSFLVEIIHQQAIKDNYSEIIHALMYEKNRSMNIVSGSEDIFRVYHLYGKEI